MDPLAVRDVLWQQTGPGQSLKTAEVLGHLGLPFTRHNERQIRRVVEQLRQEGWPICSGSAGYWWARSEEDIAQTVALLRGRAMNQLVLCRKLRQHIGSLEGQQSLVLSDPHPQPEPRLVMAVVSESVRDRLQAMSDQWGIPVDEVVERVLSQQLGGVNG